MVPVSRLKITVTVNYWLLSNVQSLSDGLWPVSSTSDSAVLSDLCQHRNDGHLLLMNDRPEVIHSLRQRSLYKAQQTDWVKVMFIVPLNTKLVIFDTLFPANLPASTEKTKTKPGETTTKIYNTPRLMQKKKTINSTTKATICLKQLFTGS